MSTLHLVSLMNVFFFLVWFFTLFPFFSLFTFCCGSVLPMCPSCFYCSVFLILYSSWFFSKSSSFPLFLSSYFPLSTMFSPSVLNVVSSTLASWPLSLCGDSGFKMFSNLCRWCRAGGGHLFFDLPLPPWLHLPAPPQCHSHSASVGDNNVCWFWETNWYSWVCPLPPLILVPVMAEHGHAATPWRSGLWGAFHSSERILRSVCVRTWQCLSLYGIIMSGCNDQLLDRKANFRT